MENSESIKRLKDISRKVRKDILSMSFRAQSAHTGGALSCVEILVALYFDFMKVFPNDPHNNKRDRLIFSKAHDCKVLYAVLAQRGFFDKKILESYEQNGGILPGHSTKDCVSGVEVSAGSLGHGLPIAAGMAYAAKLDKKKHRVFAILSDGECDEGSTWEAILFAGHHKLDNLIAVVDYNKLQGFGYTKDILDLEPFSQRLKNFGWESLEVDGNNIEDLTALFKKLPINGGKPIIVIAHTVKGLGGVPAHINQISSQYKPPTKEEFEDVLKKLT